MSHVAQGNIWRIHHLASAGTFKKVTVICKEGEKEDGNSKEGKKDDDSLTSSTVSFGPGQANGTGCARDGSNAHFRARLFWQEEEQGRDDERQEEGKSEGKGRRGKRAGVALHLWRPKQPNTVKEQGRSCLRPTHQSAAASTSNAHWVRQQRRARVVRAGMSPATPVGQRAS